MPDPSLEVIASFTSGWEKSGAAEKANYALFLTELCGQILHVPHPEPAGPDNSGNQYVFERPVPHKEADGSTATGCLHLYKARCFVLETKQCPSSSKPPTPAPCSTSFPPTPPPPLLPKKRGPGKRGTAAFDKVLTRACNQARKYIIFLPAAEGRPPFLIVCDVGHTIDLYAVFSGTGGQYERFPDPVSHPITLTDLHRPEIRDRLRRVWINPHSLDPSKHAAAVNRQVAKDLAELAKSVDQDGHDAKVTVGFLQRCLFTMFAEDIGPTAAQTPPASGRAGGPEKVRSSTSSS